uniref:RNA polymerase alpha subunit n=1 Tax=Tetraselmis marina TaxID=41888 RepID=UPI0021ACF477|nr:RNA polymerase alpha subunit [Tetraselmis marina]UUA64528.1 RNA polymerase alpha subunit [Tetraselmis marina]
MKQFFISCIESRIDDPKNIYARFKMGPFEKTQTLTIANNLRRSLLSELSGIAITAVKIQGAMHEYSTLPGIRESVLDILLNIKQVSLAGAFQINSPHLAYLQCSGPRIVTAGDIKFPAFLKCVDSDQHIATLSGDGQLNIVFLICPGKNYWVQLASDQLINHCARVFPSPELEDIEPAKEFVETVHFEKTNILPIDAVFMPVTRVNYSIEVDEEIDTEVPEEFIFLEIWTNGSIHPKIAVELAANSLIELFRPFQNVSSLYPKFLIPKGTQEIVKLYEKEKGFRRCVSSAEDGQNPSSNLDLDIGNLNLPLRPYTCLKRSGIKNIRDLLAKSRQELLLLKNFGQSSLEEVETSLYQLGFFLPDTTRLEKP